MSKAVSSEPPLRPRITLGSPASLFPPESTSTYKSLNEDKKLKRRTTEERFTLKVEGGEESFSDTSVLRLHLGSAVTKHTKRLNSDGTVVTGECIQTTVTREPNKIEQNVTRERETLTLDINRNKHFEVQIDKKGIVRFFLSQNGDPAKEVSPKKFFKAIERLEDPAVRSYMSLALDPIKSALAAQERASAAEAEKRRQQNSPHSVLAHLRQGSTLMITTDGHGTILQEGDGPADYYGVATEVPTKVKQNNKFKIDAVYGGYGEPAQVVSTNFMKDKSLEAALPPAIRAYIASIIPAGVTVYVQHRESALPPVEKMAVKPEHRGR